MAERIEYAFGESGDLTPVPNQSVGTELSIENGWSPAYSLPPDSPGYRYLDRGQHNYLWNLATGNIKQWQDQAYPQWYDNFDYPIGSKVRHNGANYNKQTNNDGSASEPGLSSDWVAVNELQSQNDIVGGSIFKGSNGEYVQDGDEVPPGTTHLRFFIDGEVLMLKAWDALTLPTTITSIPASNNGLAGYDVVTDQGTFEFVTIQTYEDRVAGKLEAWGVTELTTDAAQAITTASSYLKSTDIPLSYDGALNLITEAIMECNLSMDNSVANISGSGKMTISNTSVEALSPNQSEFTQFSREISSLSGYTGLIFIRTTEFFLTRTGTSEVVNKQEVNYVRDGKLDFPLIFDYTSSTGFSVDFYEKSSRRYEYKLPTVNADSTTEHLITITSDNFNVSGTLNSVSSPAVDSNWLRLFCSSNFTANIKTNEGMGVYGSFVAYDCYMARCVHGTFNSPDMARGSWKSIDGSNYRGVTVNGGSIEAMHSHSGGSDVRVVGTKSRRSFAFAGYDLQSTYYIDANVYDDTSFVGVRQDYGNMAGQLLVKGTFKPVGSDLSIVKMVTDVQVQAGNTNVYLLPNTIDIDLRIYGPGTSSVKIVDTRNNIEYTATERLNMYKKLTARIDYSEYAGVPNLRVGVMPYNNANHKYDIKIIDCKDNGRPIQLSIGNQSNPATDNVNCDLYVGEGVKVSNNETETRQMIPQSGRLVFDSCTLYNLMDSRSGAGSVTRAHIDISDCRWYFESETDWVNAELSSRFTKISNTIFDGTGLSSVFQGGFWVNAATGNIALNLDLKGEFSPYTEATDAYNPSVYAFAPINAVGQRYNYSLEADGSYQPTW